MSEGNWALAERRTSLAAPTLVDTGVWTWVRDRRRPDLARWFNAQVAAGAVLVCDLIVIELVRLAPNPGRATEVASRLAAFASIPMPMSLWGEARALQLALAEAGVHRSVPPADLLIAAAAMGAGVPLLHYDSDYEEIAKVSALEQHWLVPRGTL